MIFDHLLDTWSISGYRIWVWVSLVNPTSLSEKSNPISDVWPVGQTSFFRTNHSITSTIVKIRFTILNRENSNNLFFLIIKASIFKFWIEKLLTIVKRLFPKN